MKHIDPALLNEMYCRWQSAPGGWKSATVQKQARSLGVTYGTLYKMYRRMGFKMAQRKEKITKGKAKIEGLDAMAEQIGMQAFIPARARAGSLAGDRNPQGYRKRHAAEAPRIFHEHICQGIKEKELLNREGRVLRLRRRHRWAGAV